MSNLNLLEWFEYFLFGSEHSFIPPCQLEKIIIRMEEEGISWEHIIRQGGFTEFPYQVRGDLYSLIDFFLKKWLDGLAVSEPEPLRTRIVSKFWNELQTLLTKRNSKFKTELKPLDKDDTILKDMLTNADSKHTYKYSSADFWGEVARRFLNVRRPIQDVKPPPLSSCNDTLKRLGQLYDVTCQSYGEYLDPLSMYLAPFFRLCKLGALDNG